MSDPASNLAQISQRLRLAEAAHPDTGVAAGGVRLLAVSKTRSAAEIRALALLGQHAFGENYAQEAIAKQAELADLNLEWHLIGHLQSNKARLAAAAFDWVQSVDRIKLVAELARHRPSERPPLNVLVQVNIDDEASKSGCRPDEVFVLPGVAMFVGRSDEEARERLARVDDHFDIVAALTALSNAFGLDMSVYPLDEPIPDDLPQGFSKMGPSLRQRMIDWGKRDNLTLRQVAIKTAAHGHWQIAGSPKTIADKFEEYFESGAADGFSLLPGVLPSDLDSFVDLVVPELQRRGLFRTQYTGTTFRDNFGLARPAL